MLKYFSLLGAVVLSCALSAQSTTRYALVADGGMAVGTNLTLSYTVGELATATLPTAFGFLTEGVQQPHLLLLAPAPGSAESEAPLLSVFPNPATERLNLQLVGTDEQPLRLELFATDGRLLWQSTTQPRLRNYQIEVADYPAGTYHLRVTAQVAPAPGAAPLIPQVFTIVKKR